MNLKIAVNSYSFARLMDKEGLTQLDCIFLAKELGYEGIEFSEIIAPEDTTPMDYAKALAKEAKRLDMPIVNFCIAADFAKKGEAFDEEVRRVKEQVDIAEVLGVPTMRHDPMGDLAPFRTFWDALPAMAKGCRMITEYAQSKGIRTMVENHGYICQDPDRVEALYKAVDHPNFGLLTDMGNFLCADCDPVYAYGRVCQAAFFAHAKDFIRKNGNETDPGEGFFKSRGGNYLRGTIIGHGVVPVKQCLDILRNASYDGWISVEFEGIDGYCLQGKITNKKITTKEYLS